MFENPYRTPSSADESSDSISPWIIGGITTAGFLMSFLAIPLMFNLMLLFVANLMAAIVLLFMGHNRMSGLAILVFVLYGGALLLTNWGFSMPRPQTTPHWPSLVSACIVQVTLFYWPAISAARDTRQSRSGKD